MNTLELQPGMRIIEGVSAEQEPEFFVGGTDGVRGRARYGNSVEEGYISDVEVTFLTAGLVGAQREAGHNGPLVVGYDTRPTGPAFERAAIAGAMAVGMQEKDIIRLGVAPTPMILRTAQRLGAAVATPITASHNAAPDNGWKGTYGSHKPVDGQNQEINDRFWQLRRSGLAVPEHIGDYQENPEYREQYISDVVDDVRRQFNNERPLEGKIVVVDGAYGAGKDVTPKVFEALGATVVPYACDDSGNINQNCGATKLEGLEVFLKERPELVQNKNFLGACANDGDADRFIGLGARFKDGEMAFDTFDGNHVMELLAEGRAGIIGTEYTNDGMVERLKAVKTGFEFCPNGDVNVTKALRAKQQLGQQWTRGGEFTGHHVDTDWLSSGDGVRMAAWVAAYAAVRNTNLSELAQHMPLWPEVMKPITLATANGKDVMKHEAVITSIDKAREAIIASGGRLLVRASGTEIRIVRAWGVGPNENLIRTSLDTIEATTGHFFNLAA
jgi:phosphoglucosamine mutase